MNTRNEWIKERKSMKSGPQYLTLITSMIAVMAMWQPKTLAQETFSSVPVSASTAATGSLQILAISDQHHWQNFLKLAAKPNAVVTLEDIKKSFNESMVSTTMSGSYEIPNVLKYHASVPERLHELFPDRKQVHVDLYFHDKNPRTCLTKESLVSDLKGAGWKPLFTRPEIIQPGLDGGPPVHYPPETVFLKGDQGVFSIAYTSNCPESVSMDANKLYFDLLTHKKTSENGQ
jgi:hypothetical protein